MLNPIHEREHLVATNYVGLASYTFLIYDHLLTFSDEVEYVWKGRKGLVAYLFFLNRYFFPLAFIVNLYAYLSPNFSYEMCTHFVRYEGATVIVGFGLAGLMMMLRVKALYGGGNKLVQAILGMFWIIQVVVYAWFLSMGRPVARSSGIHGCSMIFDPDEKAWPGLSAVVVVVFDTVVLSLTLNKTSRALRGTSSSALLKTLMNDGVLYYGVVFATNLALTVMIITAPPGLKNILGQVAQLITVTMMSRITLHLRSIAAQSSGVVYLTDADRPPAGDSEGTAMITFATATSSTANHTDSEMGLGPGSTRRNAEGYRERSRGT